METSVDKHPIANVCPSCGTNYPLDVSICPMDQSQLIKQMPDPLIGMMLPRHYRITGKLGRGAMSIVYRGVYEPLEQEVAIKLLRSHLVSDHQTFHRFQQEAKTAGALEHQNIVGIFDFGVTDQGVPYLIMELLRGQSLAERLKKERCLSVETALETFIQTADALDYTHQRGIIHRDVKPSNILLVPSGGRDVVKIVDFGIAKLQAYEGNPGLNLTATGEVFGTPLYVSPEQATGKSIDPRADIYSLGCVMYEAIVGRPAFSGPTAFDVIRMQITTDPMPIHKARPDLDLPPPLSALITRAMAKNPDDRYQRMSDLLLDLHRAQSMTATTKLTASKTRAAVGSHDNMKAFKEPNALNQPRDQSKGVREAIRISKTDSPILPAAHGQSRGRSKFPFMAFVIACISGCLAGVLLVFCMQHIRKADDPPPRVNVPPSKVAATAVVAIGAKASVEMDPESLIHRNKAQQLFKRQKFAAAEKEERQAIASLVRLKNRAGQGVALSDLCRIYTEDGKFSDASAAGRQAVELLQKDNSQKLNLAIAMEGLAQLAIRKDELQQAGQFYENALQIKKELLAEDDPEIAKTLHDFAVLKQLQGSYAAASDFYKQALSIRKAKLAKNSPETANTLCCLGTLNFEQKKYENAEQCLTQAFVIDSSEKRESEAVARDLACLAKLYEAEHRFDQAETSMRQSLEMTNQVYGHGSSRLLPRLKALAVMLRNHQKIVEAQALEREAKAIEQAK